jgi:phospholipase/carboxylesterase
VIATAELGGLRTLVIEVGATRRLGIVMLHGYAMTPESLSPFANSLGMHARFYVPAGPVDAVPEGRAWWPLDLAARARALEKGPRDLAAEHPAGAPAAREKLLALLAKVRSDVGDCPVAVIGFSQGGMLACDTYLRHQPDIDALALLSSSRINADEWAPLAHRLEGLPVFVSHGEQDGDLAFGAGLALRDFVASGGAKVTWVPFDQGHEIPLVVWRALRKFLTALAPVQ